MSTERTPACAPITYWVNAAREQNRWRVELRRQSREALQARRYNGRLSGRLLDDSLRCRERREIFMAEARLVRGGAQP